MYILMTRLNITNKSIYKLKKNKNQSKKNLAKKRKYRKRKKRRGKSFRKKRKKYNIKNNSVKNYTKQQGGAKKDDETTQDYFKRLGKEVGANTISITTIIPYIDFNIDDLKENDDFNDIIKKNNDTFGIKNIPYINNDDEGQDTYARAISRTADPFDYTFKNYYLNKNIEKDGISMPLYQMIIQRISKYIKYVIKTQDDKDLQTASFKNIGSKIKEYFPNKTSKFRNYIEEKQQTLKFIKWLLNLTKNINNNYKQELKTTIDQKQLAELFYVYTPKDSTIETTAFTKAIDDEIQKINQPVESQLLESAMEKVKNLEPLQDCGNYTDNTKENDYKNYLNIATKKSNGEEGYEDWMDEQLYGDLNSNIKDNEVEGEKQADIKNQEEQANQETKKIKKMIKEQLEKQEKEQKEIEQKIETLNKQISKLKETNDKKQTELDKKNKEIAENKSSLAERKAIEANEKVKKEEEKIEGLNKQLEEQNANIQQSKDELEALKQELSKCKSDLEKGNQDNAEALNKQKQENETKIQNLENKIKEDEEKIKLLEKEKEKKEKNRDNLREASTQANEQAANAETDLKAAKNAVNNNENSVEQEKEESKEEEGDQLLDDLLNDQAEDDDDAISEAKNGGAFIWLSVDENGNVNINSIGAEPGDSAQNVIKNAAKPSD